MYNKNVLNKRIGGTKINRFHSIKNNEGMILGPVSNMIGILNLLEEQMRLLNVWINLKWKVYLRTNFLKS